MLFIFVALPAYWIAGRLTGMGVPDGIEEWNAREHYMRVRSDMRSVSTAVEGFYDAHGEYPKSESYELNGRTVSRFARSVPSLTSPVSYWSLDYPIDPYPDFRDVELMYFTNGQWWIMWSTGPDEDYDITAPVESFDTADLLPLRVVQFTYDSTNGTFSNGDIWRVRMH